jgi:hypothetical protein
MTAKQLGFILTSNRIQHLPKSGYQMGSLQQHQGAMDLPESSHRWGGGRTDEGWWGKTNRDGPKLLKGERPNERYSSCKNQAKNL